jgi:hypothetical protein
VLTALLLFLFASVAHAKEHPPWRLGLNLQVVSDGFDLQPRDGDNTVLHYRPAQSDYVGVVLGYRWVAGTVAFKVPASDSVRMLEGESQYRDYRLSYFLNNLGAEASYTRYMGYLIDPSTSLSAATLNGQTYYKIPDLETLGYGLNLVWVPSPRKYNLAAALDQSEIQDESGGAWLLLATWRYQKIQSNYPWIPAEKQSVYGSDQTIRFAVTNSYGVGGGYSYNWIPSDIFFISALIGLTLGYENVSWVEAASEQTRGSIGLNAHFRLVMGVNVEEFIFTLGGYQDYFNPATDSIRIGNNVNGAVLTSVVRF